jgi:hypothetical protein
MYQFFFLLSVQVAFLTNPVRDYSPKLAGVAVIYLTLESIAAANKPTPNPAIKLPTKYKAD